jgi:hypothetical protein
MNNNTYSYNFNNVEKYYNDKTYYAMIILILLFSIGFFLFIHLYCYNKCDFNRRSSYNSYNRI